MPRGSSPAPALEMSNRHYLLLDYERHRHSCSVQLCTRINILLRAYDGESNKGIARTLQVSLNTVKSWRKRWESEYEKLQIFENGKDGEGVKNSKLRKRILEILSDLPRSGAPPKISMSQKQQIVALACEEPRDYGYEINEWTTTTLAKAAIDKQIVETISASHVGRILKNKRVTTA